MMYKRCTRCVMDNESDQSITFLSDGTCNYCNDVLSRKNQEYFPNEEGKSKLESIISKIKEDCKDDPYDCMVGVSGGIDSSYIIYLGYKYGLRMLAIHIDDGFDTPTAVENLRKLCEKAEVKLVSVQPDPEQYYDLTLSFFKASVPNLAFPQDNILLAALDEYAKKNNIKYSLSGANFAHECILERGENPVNAADAVHLKAIQKKFGTKKIDKLPKMTLMRKYIGSKFFSKVKTIKPLNYIDYNLEKALKDLNEFCGFEYYGGKHYESVLTRYLQCYYLPMKYNLDKRKSHFSSLIVNGQMSREDAIEKLKTNPYLESELFAQDEMLIAEKCGISVGKLREFVNRSALPEAYYPCSVLNKAAPIARRFRRVIG